MRIDTEPPRRTHVTAMPAPGPGGVPAWRATLRLYSRPWMLSMLALGFSCGLPFMLIFSTLSAWLRQSGVALVTIGMFSWVSLVYTLKFLWAPVVDRLRLPFIGPRLGQRRSWMLAAQLGIAASLAAISASDAGAHVGRVVGLALCLAFAAATQDIAVDAWRIETAAAPEQGAMAAAYQLGYRLALIAGSAGALWIAADGGWPQAYEVMAMLTAIGVLTTLLVREPERRVAPVSLLMERRVVDWLERRPHWPAAARRAGAWLLGAVICPVMDFFARYGGRLGLLLFAFIGTYRLTDFTMGVMANPFYLDMGFTLKQVAAVAKVYGTLWSFAGILLGGLAVARFGRTRSLVLGSVLVMLSNLGYAALASHRGAGVLGLATVISLDNFAQGAHGTALRLHVLADQRLVHGHAVCGVVLAVCAAAEAAHGNLGVRGSGHRLRAVLCVHGVAQHPGADAALCTVAPGGIRAGDCHHRSGGHRSTAAQRLFLSIGPGGEPAFLGF